MLDQAVHHTVTEDSGDALTGKVIYIVSQEKWGGMFISKHHYASELARRGNKVFFINAPHNQGIMKRGEIKLSPSGFDGLTVVDHRTFFPLFLRYKAPWLYRVLLPWHLRQVIRATGCKPDVVWSFDLSDTICLGAFPGKPFRIFMPVDESTSPDSIRAGKDADVILSVTYEILDRYPYQIPKYFVNHGVAEKHICSGPFQASTPPLKVGYSGSVLRDDIDLPIMKRMVIENPHLMFEFFGEYDYAHSVIHLASNRNPVMVNFVDTLKQLPNVRFHGIVPQSKLAEEIRRMDILLICYDVTIEQSHGTNYHKVLEYLGSGKCILSNNITTYEKHYPGMITMTSSRTDNEELPEKLKEISLHIDKYNAPEEQQRRSEFASQFTYPRQIRKIAAIMEGLTSKPSGKS